MKAGGSIGGASWIERRVQEQLERERSEQESVKQPCRPVENNAVQNAGDNQQAQPQQAVAKPAKVRIAAVTKHEFKGDPPKFVSFHKGK